MGVVSSCVSGVFACLGDKSTGPTVPTTGIRVTISDTTFEGGPALWSFWVDSTGPHPVNVGTLSIQVDLTALLVVEPDSSLTKRFLLLKAESIPFTYGVRDSGQVTFSLGQPWPFWQFVSSYGGPITTVLSDSLVSQFGERCFNDDCSNRIRLSARWNRIQSDSVATYQLVKFDYEDVIPN